MSGFELALVTNRKLCAEPLALRAERVLKAGAGYILLREKDLPQADFRTLAAELAQVCKKHGGRLIINSRIKAAAEIGAWGLQLPFDIFMAEKNRGRLTGFKVGVSIHSVQEAQAAKNWGANWILAGHIFETDCKAGRPGRGLSFLTQLRKLDIPIWAIGGLKPERAFLAAQAGAEVICVMSGLLQSPEPEEMVGAYLRAAQAEK